MNKSLLREIFEGQSFKAHLFKQLKMFLKLLNMQISTMYSFFAVITDKAVVHDDGNFSL
ncbi:Uncharacterised protein [Vibrio cholerae]|uniref:Uncharacterized protein n=1 Tax=Vibrio cholerae TaxID=666 RepID=A0A655YRT3_VIBCL|nr:Uncharacterised protein [Vibrio cholerae]